MTQLEIAVKGAAPARFEIGSGVTVIGRSEAADLRVVGDTHVSRRHAEISVQGERLRVRRLAESSNPVYHAGAPKEEFSILPATISSSAARASPSCPTSSPRARPCPSR